MYAINIMTALRTLDEAARATTTIITIGVHADCINMLMFAARQAHTIHTIYTEGSMIKDRGDPSASDIAVKAAFDRGDLSFTTEFQFVSSVPGFVR